MKTQAIPHLTTTFAFWYLRLASELVYDPDDRTADPRGTSERYGIELSNTYRLNGWLTFDLDWSASQAHFLSIDQLDNGSPTAVTGPAARMCRRPSASSSRRGRRCGCRAATSRSLRYRYIGPRDLSSDGLISSHATNEFDLGLGYECLRFTVGVNILNLFNAERSGRRLCRRRRVPWSERPEIRQHGNHPPATAIPGTVLLQPEILRATLGDVFVRRTGFQPVPCRSGQVGNLSYEQSNIARHCSWWGSNPRTARRARSRSAGTGREAQLSVSPATDSTETRNAVESPPSPGLRQERSGTNLRWDQRLRGARGAAAERAVPRRGPPAAGGKG